MSISATRGNILISGIASWKIKDITTPDVAYHSLPFLRNGKVQITTVEALDKSKRQYPFAFKLEASVETMASSVANLIKLLPNFGTKQIDHKITAINGTTISTSLMATPGIGTNFEVVADRDMDGIMFVRITISRYITEAEYEAIQGAPPADGVDPGTDTFHLIDSLTRADVRVAGFSKIEFQTGGGGYNDRLQNIRNGKITATGLTIVDSKKEALVYGVKFHVEGELLQASATELGYIDDIAVRENDWKITMVNGTVVTLASTLGISFEYHLDKDSDDVSFVKFSGDGNIPLSSFAALWT